MGNVLRAIRKSGPGEASTDGLAIHAVSMAVAGATQAASQALKAPPEGPQATSAPTQTPVETAPAPPHRARPPAARPAGPVSPLLLVHHQPRALASEQIRQLRSSLQHLVATGPIRCMVTSARPGEGRSVTAANLGCCFAEINRRRTLVIDADLQGASLAGLLGTREGPGLADLLAGRCTPEQAIHPTWRDNLCVVPAGLAEPCEAAALLSADNAASAVAGLMKGFDHVIIDTPCAQGLSDAGIVGRWVNLALLAVRIHKTPRSAVESARHMLEQAGVSLAGIVALDDHAEDRRYYDRQAAL